MKKLPIYRLVIDEKLGDGVSYVALVDSPAIQTNWIAFSEQEEFKFQISDTEKRIISGPLMIPDLPIYRNNKKLGEFYAVFDSQTIEQIVQSFFKSQNTSNVNLMHSPDEKVDGVYMFESFIINKERGVLPPKGFEQLNDGSWFGSYKVENEAVWDEFIKTGELRGFSVEGFFTLVPVQDPPTDLLTEIQEMINAL